MKNEIRIKTNDFEYLALAFGKIFTTYGYGGNIIVKHGGTVKISDVSMCPCLG